MASRILLVGDSETRPYHLSERLADWGGECQFASCRADVSTLIRSQRFDLVLSRMRLSDGSAFELIPLVNGRPTSLFSYLPTKDGCWWLPLVRSGAECSSGPALQDTVFMQMLEGLVKRIPVDSRRVAYGATLR
jgi:hypothetical protein